MPPCSETYYDAKVSNADEVDRKEVKKIHTYTTYAGSPIGNLGPEFIGQVCYDTTNKDFYIATDTAANTDWAATAFPDLSPAEINVLDGVTVGTGLASKVLTLDANGDFLMPASGHFKSSAAVLPATGSNAGNAAIILNDFTVVTGADGTKGVALPAAAANINCTVINDSETYALFVYPVSGGDDMINEIAEDDPFIVAPGREVRFISTSATQWYTKKDKDVAGVEKFVIEDDFHAAALDATDKWIAYAGSEGAATIAVTVSSPEGTVKMDCAATADNNAGSVLSSRVTTHGALVSLGGLTFETRVALDALTAGFTFWCGLSDTAAGDTNEDLPHLVDGGTVSDGGLSCTDAVGFSFSTDATATTMWTATSEKNTSIETSEASLGVGPTGNAYDVLRIEVDADGDARWYVNGVLKKTKTTAVNTTAVLIPFWGIDKATDAQTERDVTIDRVRFEGNRPSTN